MSKRTAHQLSRRLEELHQATQVVEAQLANADARKKFLCQACKKMHAIKDCVVIQTHYYVRPHGCTGGDYWCAGELQVVCPKTKIRNRLLFESYYKTPYEIRGDFNHNAEQQFKYRYKELFKEVVDEHNDRTPDEWVNNYYIDQNHKKFGIKI